jgi:hypothetical protein
MMTDTYKQACLGKFTSILKWEALDDFWLAIRASRLPWFIYDTNLEPPGATVDKDELSSFLQQVDAQLRERHKQDYCGIVYADSIEQPSLVKIYDPDNLGVVCGYSDNPPLPRWILSQLQPSSLARPAKAPPLWRKWLPGF